MNNIRVKVQKRGFIWHAEWSRDNGPFNSLAMSVTRRGVDRKARLIVDLMNGLTNCVYLLEKMGK